MFYVEFFFVMRIYFLLLLQFVVDCPDPLCSNHGACVEGQCFCKAGWQGENCEIIDQQVYQCLPDCSEHGTYDLEKGECVCEANWTGPHCSQGRNFK